MEHLSLYRSLAGILDFASYLVKLSKNFRAVWTRVQGLSSERAIKRMSSFSSEARRQAGVNREHSVTGDVG
jgi:hypothetical protein